MWAGQDRAGGDPGAESPALGLSTTRRNFGTGLTERGLSVFNAGTGNLEVTSVTPSSDVLGITPPSSTDGTGVYTITVDRTGLDAGIYEEEILFDSNAGSATLFIQFEVVEQSSDVTGDVGQLYIFLFDRETSQLATLARVASNGTYEYEFTGIEPGVYLVVAGSDPDNDGIAGDLGEARGIYPNTDTPLLLVANQDFQNIDFDISYDIPLAGTAIQQTEERSPSVSGSDQCLNAAGKERQPVCIDALAVDVEAVRPDP
ncbi:MAG: hypothetical protein HUJ31_10210 [Pseudomonadales bacterium]|nr:hypothetical protein [Pseudomonadales bacterium]